MKNIKVTNAFFIHIFIEKEPSLNLIMSRIPILLKPSGSISSCWNSPRNDNFKSVTILTPKHDRPEEIKFLHKKIIDLEIKNCQLNLLLVEQDLELQSKNKQIKEQAKLVASLERKTNAGIFSKNINNFCTHKKDAMIKNQQILLDVRSSFIVHLLEKDETIQNLIKTNERTQCTLDQLAAQVIMNNEAMEKLRIIIDAKDTQIDKLGKVVDVLNKNKLPNICYNNNSLSENLLNYLDLLI